MLAWLADLVVWGGYALLVGWGLGRAGAGDVASLVVVLLPVLLYDLAFELLAEGRRRARCCSASASPASTARSRRWGSSRCGGCCASST